MQASIARSDPGEPDDMLEFFLTATQDWVPMDKIDPNPFRDIDNYPLDAARMDALEASMRDTGVWPVFLGRRRPDDPSRVELAFAHHRWAVAKRIGLPGLNIAIVDLADHQMIQIMGNENSEHWGNNVAHNNLTVKQARNYLDSFLDQFDTWESFTACKFAGCNWLPDPKWFDRSKREGVGTDVITSFLGGAWSARKVSDSLLQIGRSSKRIAVDNETARLEKERIDAERREREASLAKQREESERAAAARRKAQEEAKAAADAQRRAEAEVKRAKAEAQEAERRSRAAVEHAERAERERMAAELLEAQQRTREAEEAERKRTEQVERVQRELEAAMAQEEAKRAEEERVKQEMEDIQREELEFITRYGDQYDYRAGELLKNTYQAKAFRQAVMSEKALAAGLTREQHLPLAQEILRKFAPPSRQNNPSDPSFRAMASRDRPPIEERLTSENIAAYINAQIEDRLSQHDEEAAARMRHENGAARVQKALHEVVTSLKRAVTALAQASSEIRRFAEDEPGFQMRGFEVSDVREVLDVFETELERFREVSNLDETKANGFQNGSVINVTATAMDGGV